MAIRVQEQDFDMGAEITQLRLNHPQAGAVVSFTGQVRDLNDGNAVSSLTLEHYPGMTEKSLAAIVEQAKQRWPLFDALVIHRIGTLPPLAQIVLVAVASAHRGDAFAACEFIMDYLKTEAPFWKKEATPDGAHWLDSRECDQAARDRWQ
ncbi:molybdopterin synthase catalytic subunit MoaE [Methylobacillus arboreus]|uniref:molybdopterin synthase catalytic subunit MoaE n=1 Tax=Methylobacillus arboreus TaxID=755170 RepID=UPI001E645EA9|nr:molybdopterin synthase catalytic subunit MoaE [Methylobacillus arboreus]MCB5189989.1 molybdopterin synthase catalytic subunit MoaE [Methylobacillus arboreus]